MVPCGCCKELGKKEVPDTWGRAHAASAAPACGPRRPSRRSCVQFLGSCRAHVLRDTPGAVARGAAAVPTPGSALAGRSLRQEPTTCRPLAGQRTQGPVAQPGQWPLRGRADAKPREEELRLCCAWTVKVTAQEFKVPPCRHQLFLCSCTTNKLFYGMRHVRLCCGKPGVTV